MKIAKDEFINKKSKIKIEPWGSEKSSKVVKDNTDVVVSWNTSNIVYAIRNYAI